MVKRYLEALNSGRMPNIMDTWSFIREEKARQVAEHLREVYTERIKIKLGNKFPMPALRLN
jgi:hypothetical protein